MPRRLVLAALAAACTLAVVSPANAANLSISGGTLSYTGGAGQASAVRFDQTAARTVTITRLPQDGDSIGTPPAGCAGGPQIFSCTGVASVFVDAGDAND